MNTIRPYTPSDKSEVLQLIKLNTPEYFTVPEHQQFSDFLDNEIEQYFVIEVDGKILGCGGINTSKEKRSGVLSWGMIHPDYHQKRLGSKLAIFRIERLKSIPHVDIIEVNTTQKTFGFFKKLGFETTKIEKDYWAEGFDLYRMKLMNYITE